jgi:hypothetical protein
MQGATIKTRNIYFWNVLHRNKVAQAKYRDYEKRYLKRNEPKKVILVRKLLQVEEEERYDLKFSLRSLS